MKTTTVYLVSKSQPDYDCGSTWTSVLNNRGYKTRKRAYDVLVADMLKEMGLKSINDVPADNDYEKCQKLYSKGIENWGIPEDENDSTHKTCDGYIQTSDGEITYEIQEMEIEEDE